MKEFRPIEELAQDDLIEVGDLILLREHRSYQGEAIDTTTRPIFYMGLGTHVIRSKDRSEIKVGTKLRGIRVGVEHLVDHTAKNRARVCGDYGVHDYLKDRVKGNLIPFKDCPKDCPPGEITSDFTYEYALLECADVLRTYLGQRVPKK
jgi:hypothetical protein